jgi:hypothetical protein
VPSYTAVFGLPGMVGPSVAREALLLHKSVVCLATGQYSNCTVAEAKAQLNDPTVEPKGVGEPHIGEL